MIDFIRETWDDNEESRKMLVVKKMMRIKKKEK